MGTPIEIPVSQCKAPNKSRLLRKIDRMFVEKLKERMLEDPTAPGTPPLALLCYNKKRDMVEICNCIYSYMFNSRYICFCFLILKKKEYFLSQLAKEYHNEVLGGLHTLTAKQELHNDRPGIFNCIHNFLMHSVVNSIFV